MSTAGDAILAMNAASAAFPPLQAATGLVLYIDQSIARFKSNRNEIKAVGGHSKLLSEQLARHRPTDPKGTEDFRKVINDILAYVKDVSKKNALVQYFQRSVISDRIQDYRARLQERFELFSITSDIDVQESHRTAAEARKADAEAIQAMQEEIRKVAEQLTTSPIGVSQFATKYGLAKIQRSSGDVYKELETTSQEGLTQEETTVLQESRQLSKMLFKSDYRWFSDTFNSKEFCESDVQGALAEVIFDIVRKLEEARLLASATRMQLQYEYNAPAKVAILFRSLNMRSRDAPFIRTFQRAVYGHRESLDSYLSDSLKESLEEES
ncbi:hypothetical protein B0H16DRAFT_1884846 [Mycena metata]|uniref:Uncharacterized protein n=1 Tax=Mycena metata TaxID=1033252 RepID=A0AAD7JBZ8_9AGAR|nr:hypothetical protein B0H16DRAFT_1884846 [Mycena metata]